MATLKLEIITPAAKVFSDDVEMVTLTGIDGEMGIEPITPRGSRVTLRLPRAADTAKFWADLCPGFSSRTTTKCCAGG